MSGFYLLDRDTARKSYYTSRHGSILAVVMHVTAGLQGRPAGADSSAEQTAKYAATTDRAVSWHSGSDTDSHLQLLPDSFTAFHCQGYNSRTIGHEISKRDVSWADEDPLWVTKTLEQAVASLRGRVKALGIPPRWASKAELDRAIATNGPPVGFVDHSALDPDRRQDPGRDFPRNRFLSLLLLGGRPATPPPVLDEEDEVLRLIRRDRGVGNPGHGATYLVGPGVWNYIEAGEQRDVLVAKGFSRPPVDVNDREYDQIREALLKTGVDQ